MKTPFDYVLFEQIQNLKIDYYKITGKGISFFNAVSRLQSTGNYSHGIPENPDFLSWNLLNYRDLKKMVCQIPVPLSDVLGIGRHTEDNTTHLSTKNKVQISMESCYSDGHFVSVDYFAVFYVLEGSCTLSLKNGKHLLQAGELCILPPAMPYSVFTGPEDFIVTIISDRVHFHENFQSLLYHDNIVSSFFRKSLFQDSHDCFFFMMPPSKDIRSIIQHLFSEFVRRDSYSNSLFNNYLQIFYANIIRSTESTYHFYSSRKETSARTLMPAILAYIAQNYRSLSLDQLAQYFHYENAYLSKLIKKSTGKNYSAIVAELKLKEAAQLLRTTDLKIEEIAEMTGYGSADHFAASFKKKTGMSPRAYKKADLAEGILSNTYSVSDDKSSRNL